MEIKNLKETANWRQKDFWYIVSGEGTVVLSGNEIQVRALSE